MKKGIIVGAVILIILIIIGVWLYLFTYGKPQEGESVFARFGLGEETTDPASLDTRDDDAPLPSDPEAPFRALRQLTTKPVSGATFTGTGILYVEDGTGHLYHLNLKTDTATLVSGTTILGAYDATFSAGGAYVAITSYQNQKKETVVGTVSLEGGNGTLSGKLLPEGATEISIDSAKRLVYYFLPNKDGGTGFAYHLDKETNTELFRVPLGHVRVLWGSPTYLYTTPTPTERGFLYKVEKNDLSFVTNGAPALSALKYENGIVITSLFNSKPTSEVVGTGTPPSLPIPLIPEKCTVSPERKYDFVCALPNVLGTGTYPDMWYKGLVSYSDTLWGVQIKDRTLTVLSDMQSESGREVDVAKIGTDGTGLRVYLINKNDNTLWMYSYPEVPEPPVDKDADNEK